MSTTTLILLIAGIAGYLAFVAFVLALLRGARNLREAAEEQHPHALATRTERFSRLDGEMRLRDGTPDDLEFLDQWAARELAGERRRPRRHAG
jgi:hypothetical protein